MSEGQVDVDDKTSNVPFDKFDVEEKTFNAPVNKFDVDDKTSNAPIHKFDVNEKRLSQRRHRHEQSRHRRIDGNRQLVTIYAKVPYNINTLLNHFNVIESAPK